MNSLHWGHSKLIPGEEILHAPAVVQAAAVAGRCAQKQKAH